MSSLEQKSFLGHVISKDGLQVDPEKIAAVKQFPVPTKQTHVKSFLGLCSYYRRYVKHFAIIARSLHKASETSTPFKWSPEAQEAFHKLKACLTTTPILALPSMKAVYSVHRRYPFGNGCNLSPNSRRKGMSHLLSLQGSFTISNELLSN